LAMLKFNMNVVMNPSDTSRNDSFRGNCHYANR
jgi:hypothetical protein